MRLAGQLAAWPECRVPAGLQATLQLHRSRGREAIPVRCSNMQPAPEAGYVRSPWCRPLSGCSPSAAIDGPVVPSLHTSQLLPPVVALGKFDALHKGHRALAAAAAALGGAPWLVSFSGIAEVLGWPARLPLVAPCDRRRVLASWAQHCQGRVPQECAVPFAEVRMMSPDAFVELLATELQVAGVVVGSNYRFGYRAAGTASLLRSLGPQHGLQVQVLDLVAGTPDANGSAGGSSSSGATAAHKPAAGQAAAPATLEQQQQQQPGPQQQQHGGQLHGQGLHAAERAAAHEAASSSRVRHALAHGDMADAALCLDRPYRLVASMADDPTSTMLTDGAALRLPTSSLCNQPPRPGMYEVVAMLAGAETLQELGTPRHVQLSLDETGLSLHGCGDWASALPPGAAHVSLDFL